MPDFYDRQIGNLHDLPDVVKTSLANSRFVPPMGVGGTQVYLVQTFRQAEKGDTIFLETSGPMGNVRLVIPPAVSKIIARQREALTAKSRSRHARRVAADRMAQGIKPFVKKEKVG